MHYPHFFRHQFSQLEAIICPGDPEGPVIVFCHGYGANANDLLFFPTACPFVGCRPTWVFPHGIESLSEYPGGRAWFPLDVPLFNSLISNPNIDEHTEAQYQKLFDVDFEKPTQALKKLIEELDCPRNEIIIGGFSQGAMMTTHLILSSKVPYKGALIFSGACLVDKKWEESIQICGHTPFLQSHGHTDAIIPYYHGEKLHKLLSQRLSGEFVGFQGGHDIPVTVIKKMQTLIPQWRSTKA